MGRETVLLVDTTAFLAASSMLNATEVSGVMLVAMEIAEHGPIAADKIRQIARLRGKQRWLDPEFERYFFKRCDGGIELNETIFGVQVRGSDRRSNLSESVRQRIHERDGYRCTYCGDEDGPFHVDHIIPVSRGGSDEDSNLCLACVPCNLSKRAKLLSEWRAEA